MEVDLEIVTSLVLVVSLEKWQYEKPNGWMKTPLQEVVLGVLSGVARSV